MINKIKNILQNKIIQILFFLLIIMFVFGSSLVIILSDNDDVVKFKYAKNITKSDFNIALSLDGERYKSMDIEENKLRDVVLNDLITRRLLVYYAEEIHFIPSDKYINSIIKKSAIFIVDKKFDINRFQKYLSILGTSEKKYKQIIKEKIQEYFIKMLFSNTGKELGFEGVKHLFEKREIYLYKKKLDFNKQIKLDQISDIDLRNQLIKLQKAHNNQLFTKENLSENMIQLKQYYESNIENYKTPEERTIKYIVLDKLENELVQDIEKDITNGDKIDDLVKRYDLTLLIANKIQQDYLPVILQYDKDRIFDMKVGFVSYPKNIDNNKMILYEVSAIHDNIARNLEDIIDEVIQSYNKQQVKEYNTNLIQIVQTYIKNQQQDITHDDIIKKLKRISNILQFDIEITDLNSKFINKYLYNELQGKIYNISNSYFNDQYGVFGYVYDISYDADLRNKNQDIKNAENNYFVNLFITELLEYLKNINEIK